MRLVTPASGPEWLPAFARSIIAAFGQKMPRPFWLWGSPTAGLPPTPELGANEGAIAYDETVNAPTYYDGLNWIRLGAYDATLAALAAYNTNGLLTQIAADTFTGRTITGTANEITVTNGSGVAGNPTLSLPSALTFTGKTVTGGTFASAVMTGLTDTTQLRSTGQSTPGSGAGVELEYTASIGYVTAYNRGAATWQPLYLRGSSVVLQASGVTIGTVSSTGLDIVGEARCDSFRIDATPSVSVATASTHKLAINCDGTTYYLLLSNV